MSLDMNVGEFCSSIGSDKLGCVVGMVVDTILPHAESGQNDHRKDAPRL